MLSIGLFVVNHALQRTGLVAKPVDDLAAFGVDMRQPGPLFVGTFLLCNIVSNVPAVMLLRPLAQQPWAGPLLALVSTLAGNLLIVGSIANIIVVDNAARDPYRLASPRMHRRAGDIGDAGDHRGMACVAPGAGGFTMSGQGRRRAAV